jgi:hypothetical protein
MGACDFRVRSKGKTAREAFQAAVQQAQYDYGHAGYTGTIAEKDRFTEVPIPPEFKDRPGDFVRKLEEEDRFSDKWGPAGCVRVAEGEYVFFGWASS